MCKRQFLPQRPVIFRWLAFIGPIRRAALATWPID
jgi:hypothetical protein